MNRQPGPAKRPTEKTRLLGNPGHETLPDKAAGVGLKRLSVDEIEIHDHVRLGSGGQWLFRFIIENVPWLAVSDVPAVIRAAELEDERLRAKVRLFRYENFKDARVMRDIDKLQGSIFSALGMSPADRTRLNVGEVQVQRD